MTELQVLQNFYATIPEPDADTVVAARAALLQLVDPPAAESRRRPRQARAYRPNRLAAKLSPNRSTRTRVVASIILAGLLLAGVATATYVGVRRWIAAYQTPATSRIDWVDFTLGPGGRDLYAIRVEGWLRHRASAELVRIRGIDHPGRPHATRVFDFDTIAAPGWRFHSPFPDQGLGIAANGDIFLLAAGLDSPWRSMTSGGTGPFVVFVRRRDDSRQMILSAGELVRSGALPADADYTPRMAVTAPNRIWFEVEIYGPWAGTFRDHSYRFLEIIDPNADGNWSDAVIRPLAIPRSLPVGGHGVPNPWRWLQIAPDPTVTNGEGVLASALGPGIATRVRVAGAGHTFGIRHPMDATTAAWETVASATMRRLLEILT